MENYAGNKQTFKQHAMYYLIQVQLLVKGFAPQALFVLDLFNHPSITHLSQSYHIFSLQQGWNCVFEGGDEDSVSDPW